MRWRPFVLTAGALCGALVLGCEAPALDVHPLTGSKAPLFASTTLDGAPFDLATYLGQDVVILDFWATWCGPCREAMPILQSVATQFEDQGVKLFAVNVEESPEQVQEFLDASGLDVTVVMDPDGAINRLYQVEFLPQTVIIGRDGTVAEVHLGVSRDLKSELTRELGALVKDSPTAKTSPVARPSDVAGR